MLLQGNWSADDLRRAFVAGAAWWEFHSTKGTIWPSDRDLAEAEAERRYPGGQLKPMTVHDYAVVESEIQRGKERMMTHDAIKSRLADATPGPWYVIARGTARDWDVEDAKTDQLTGYTRGMFCREADAIFVANARADVPALLSEVERLRKALRDIVAMPSDGYDVLNAAIMQSIAQSVLDVGGGE